MMIRSSVFLQIERLRENTKEEMGQKNNDVKDEIDVKDLIDLVFSWSLQDVLNANLWRNKMKEIPKTFSSSTEYMKSFIHPLIEETHADLSSNIKEVSRAPYCKIDSIEKSKDFEAPKDLFYEFTLEVANKRALKKAAKKITLKKAAEKDVGKYEPEVGDLIALTDVKPKCIEDLNRRFYLIAYVHGAKNIDSEKLTQLQENDSEFLQMRFYLITSKLIFPEQDKHICRTETRLPSKNQTLVAVYLMNMTTNIRIWKALNPGPEGGNTSIIEKLLQPSSAGDANCTSCFSDTQCSSPMPSSVQDIIRSSNLNRSQEAVVLSCIHMIDCHHQNTVKLIWGPPGTGKTRTVGLLLFAFLKMKCRTLTCAPTNIAVLEVAKRLLRLARDSLEYDTYGLGDIVLSGNDKRMKIDDHEDLLDVFLDYRVDVLGKCLDPCSGWRHCLRSMISLLEYPRFQYESYLEEIEKKKNEGGDKLKKDETCFEKMKKKYSEGDKELEQDETDLEIITNISSEGDDESSEGVDELEQEETSLLKMKKKNNEGDDDLDKDDDKLKQDNDDPLTFEEYFKERLEALKFCLVNLYTHLPTSLFPLEEVEKMKEVLVMLESLESEVRIVCAANEGPQQVLNDFQDTRSGVGYFINSSNTRQKCVLMLKSLKISIPNLKDDHAIKRYCLATACLVFCTASSSARLHAQGTPRFNFLVVDEAAQLKECESAIPLQLSGLRHAILIGDEKQLPAMVKSKLSEDAEFGRSLFERLVLLGHQKHLLNVQYRMHPSISLFPKKEFYGSMISDAPKVKERDYERRFLQGNMYGSYSFISVAQGKEEYGLGHSAKNTVEAAVVSEIVANLYKRFLETKNKVSIGVISPYNAQVYAIKERVSRYSDAGSGFTVNVRSVDGFQGGEEDVIILSTVRCNLNGFVGFLSNKRRANVALTRARYCLWVVGSGSTLLNSNTVWKKLVLDAKERGCFYDANEDKNLAQAITAAVAELEQLEILFKNDHQLFGGAIWKVRFSDDFKRSIAWTTNEEVLSLLRELSTGWRQPDKEKNLISHSGTSSEFLEVYMVDRWLNLVWSVDILQEDSNYTQIIIVWDVVPLPDVPKLATRLDIVFQSYTEEKVHLCKCRHVKRNLVVPATWPVDSSSSFEPLSSLSLRDMPDPIKILRVLDRLPEEYEVFRTTMCKPPVPPFNEAVSQLEAFDAMNRYTASTPKDNAAFMVHKSQQSHGGSGSARGHGGPASFSSRRQGFTQWGQISQRDNNNSEGNFFQATNQNQLNQQRILELGQGHIVVCQICSQEGHYALNCWRHSEIIVCQICDEKGHFALNCCWRHFEIIVCQICSERGHHALNCYWRHFY